MNALLCLCFLPLPQLSFLAPLFLLTAANDISIEEALEFMGVKRGKGREIAHNHWIDFIRLLKEHSGESEERILGLARSYVGIDERYLKQFVHACLEWGTVRENNGHLYYLGVPRGQRVREKTVRGPRGGAHSEAPSAFKADDGR